MEPRGKIIDEFKTSGKNIWGRVNFIRLFA
jgi:hypothetical protein